MNVTINLVHKLKTHAVPVPLASTFQELAEVAAAQTGIPAEYLKLLYRGRPCKPQENLLTKGIKDGAKVTVVETAEYIDRQADALARQHAAAALQSQESITQQGMRDKLAPLSAQVDDLQLQAVVLQHNLQAPGARQTAARIVEMLTQKLIALDNVEVSGEAKAERKALINRANALCDSLEALKARLPPS